GAFGGQDTKEKRGRPFCYIFATKRGRTGRNSENKGGRLPQKNKNKPVLLDTAKHKKKQKPPMYTFWDYMRNRWPRDAGLRIDHLLLSAQAAKRLVSAGVDRHVRARQGASDHAPAWIMLHADAQARRNSVRPMAKTARGSARRNAPTSSRRPLLVIDGDSFAHRAYHALPKTILGRGGRPAGAILGFANFLLKFYRTEQPRAVLVGWDTLDSPTYRHEQFSAY